MLTSEVLFAAVLHKCVGLVVMRPYICEEGKRSCLDLVQVDTPLSPQLACLVQLQCIVDY